jgi:hypothetical protein
MRWNEVKSAWEKVGKFRRKGPWMDPWGDLAMKIARMFGGEKVCLS